MNTSPQMMLTLLRQLVYEAGANQADIAIGDTLCYFPNQYYDMLHAEFPDVRYLDYEGKFGRTKVQQSSVPLYWSPNPSVSYEDYVPVSYAQADYIINMANFKSHSSAAVTLCGKNHYGSLVRWPAQSGYYNLHENLPYITDGMGQYRPIVDLMGHAHIGGKTLLYLIDGLYAGHHPYDDTPTKLNSTPFNGDWSSSLFVSQDPVAIDSVAFDFLWSEPGWDVDTQMSGGDDYLHEAAQADNPPSATFYDPNHSGDVTRLASLGVHEHWNNPIDKQYSRNLDTGDGIELISIQPEANISVFPRSYNFGEVTEGYFSEATVTVTNDGSANLVIGDIASPNPLVEPFSITGDSCSEGTISPGGSCTLTVRFEPTTAGTFNDSFDISSNDPDEDPVIIGVSGVGVSSALSPAVASDGGGGCFIATAANGSYVAQEIRALVLLLGSNIIGLVGLKKKLKKQKAVNHHIAKAVSSIAHN